MMSGKPLAQAAGSPARSPRYGVVAIGRNEGERLRLCLQSVTASAASAVYVDSGSTDGSPQTAKQLGVRVVPLDLAQPFTAARARNVGWRSLLETDPDLEYVQFVDGDCEFVGSWLDEARAFLDANPDVAAVTGWRRERFPRRSTYNLLCDIEWHSGVVGSTKAFGGDAMLRASALTQSCGYRDTLIAGEDDELCIRLRSAGWRIWRLDADMTLHDAAMTRFGQWWKRSMRAGYAYAEGFRLHGAPPERHFLKQARSAWLWGFGLPVFLLLATAAFGRVALIGFAVYPVQVLRLFTRTSGDLHTRGARALFLVIGKFAEAAGLFKAMVHRASGKHGRLIEYK